MLGKLFYTPGRIEIGFNLSEERAENVISINKNKNKKKEQILDVSGPPALPLRATGSDLSLPFVRREPENQNLLLSKNTKTVLRRL